MNDALWNLVNLVHYLIYFIYIHMFFPTRKYYSIVNLHLTIILKICMIVTFFALAYTGHSYETNWLWNEEITVFQLMLIGSIIFLCLWIIITIYEGTIKKNIKKNYDSNKEWMIDWKYMYTTAKIIWFISNGQELKSKWYQRNRVTISAPNFKEEFTIEIWIDAYWSTPSEDWALNRKIHEKNPDIKFQFARFSKITPLEQQITVTIWYDKENPNKCEIVDF